MSSFNIPDYNEVDPDQPNIPSEGWHDATAVAFQPDESSNGDDMMVVTFRIDNGEDKGLEIRDWFVFGLSSMIGERQLKKVCQCAEFEWEQKETLPAFVAQFPEFELRVGLKIEWGYSIKRDGQYEDISKERYQELKDAGEDPNINTNIEGYRAAAEPSQLGGPSGDGAPAGDETFEPEEDGEIPF